MFSEFDLEPELLQAIENMGFTAPTTTQMQAIPAIKEGGDMVVTASTGSGKTLSFLVPMVQKILENYEFLEQPKKGQRVQTIILAPTRELASQINSVCTSLLEFTQLNSCELIGGEDFKDQQKELNRFPDVVIATPGRLLEHLDARSLSLKEVSQVILDESDRLCDLGFADDLLAILGHLDEDQAGTEFELECQTIMFSATTSGRTRKLAEQILKEPQFLTINARRAQNENIVQQIVLADDERHKLKLMVWLLENQPFERAIVFVNTKTQADNLCGKLRYHKQRSAVLHSNMKQSVREGTLAAYKEGRANVLVATDLAARGLDVDNIDVVINFDMARKGDDYTHRIGRTGRAGKQGESFVLIMPNEWNLMSSIERYLKIRFRPKIIEELLGEYRGPKKVKASGKAAGTKKKKKKVDPKAKKLKKKSPGKKK
ncbi:DEAD/DEAH box helicase [Litoribacillus peritrichatus]|uniref:DEAD/DEAH box helicase n=1 Tax=Litoribacillus peritrichatus TaxID=718191 RepID=A0ABP7MF67_9GAMM